MSRNAHPSVRCRLATAVLAFGLAVAAGSAAAAAEIAVGVLDHATGQYRVREAVLSKEFADGTPVDEFRISHFSIPIDDDWILIRTHFASSSGTCRTEATRVKIHDDKAWIVVQADLPKLVIDCGGLAPDCETCQLRTGSKWSCGCFAGGEDTGRSCPTGATVLSGDEFIRDWLAP